MDAQDFAREYSYNAQRFMDSYNKYVLPDIKEASRLLSTDPKNKQGIFLLQRSFKNEVKMLKLGETSADGAIKQGRAILKDLEAKGASRELIDEITPIVQFLDTEMQQLFLHIHRRLRAETTFLEKPSKENYMYVVEAAQNDSIFMKERLPVRHAVEVVVNSSRMTQLVRAITAIPKSGREAIERTPSVSEETAASSVFLGMLAGPYFLPHALGGGSELGFFTGMVALPLIIQTCRWFFAFLGCYANNMETIVHNQLSLPQSTPS